MDIFVTSKLRENIPEFQTLLLFFIWKQKYRNKNYKFPKEITNFICQTSHHMTKEINLTLRSGKHLAPMGDNWISTVVVTKQQVSYRTNPFEVELNNFKMHKFTDLLTAYLSQYIIHFHIHLPKV